MRQDSTSPSTTLYIYDKSTSYTRTITGATTKLKLANASKIDRSAVTKIAFQTNGGKPIKLSRISPQLQCMV